MNKTKTIITIFISILLIIIVSCEDINPFLAGGVVPGGNWIYFAEGSDIKRMRLDGTKLEDVFTIDTPEIRKIQLDPFKQKIYISSHVGATAERIREYNLDGSGANELLNKGAVPILDFVIDSISNVIYYADSASINQIDLKTEDVENLIVGGFGDPVSLSPDNNGNLFYTYPASPNIFKFNIAEDSSSSVITLAVPGGVVVQRNSQYLYAYDGQMIYKINHSNSASNNIYTNAMFLYDNNMIVSIIENKLFFYDNTGPFTLYNINLDGSNLNKIYETSNPISGFDILSK